MTIDEITQSLEFFGDWEERYRFIIDLGRHLPPMEASERTDANRVTGCISNVWLACRREQPPNRLSFVADSDAFIVRGLAAMLLAMYNGKTPQEILDIDAESVFQRMDLQSHLSPSRANGLYAMTEQVRSIARAATQ